MKDASNYPVTVFSRNLTTASTQAVIPNSSPKKKLEIIQACRGIAALLVVSFHVTEFSQQKLNQEFALGLFAFGVKRAIRVYPLYWIITLVLLPIYFLIPSFGKGYERDLGVIVKSLLLLPQENFPVLIVGWTLSYEIFFYCLFGLAIWFAPRISRFVLCSCLGGTLAFFWLSLGDRAASTQTP